MDHCSIIYYFWIILASVFNIVLTSIWASILEAILTDFGSKMTLKIFPPGTNFSKHINFGVWRFRPGAVLEPNWARPATQNGPKHNFYRFSIDFGLMFTDVSRFEIPFKGIWVRFWRNTLLLQLWFSSIVQRLVGLRPGVKSFQM